MNLDPVVLVILLHSFFSKMQKDQEKDKEIRLGVLAKLNNNSFVNIEIQIQTIESDTKYVFRSDFQLYFLEVRKSIKP